MDLETREILRQKVTEFSPELQRLRKADSITTDNSDAMSDLHEREIAAMALLRALHNKVVPIPGTMDFLDNLKSLRRSRDRMGRTEFVKVMKGGSANYSINPYFDEPDPKKPGLLGRLAGFFRGRSNKSEEQ